jgi:uncharacterized coiled-coil protein SlyX
MAAVIHKNKKLETKLIDGEKLISEQKDTIEKLENVNTTLLTEVKNLSSTNARLTKTESDLRAKAENGK